jgi:pilus assembly protein FimV
MKKYLLIVASFLLTLTYLPVQAATYGPVAKSETLWGIASTHRPSYDITTQQMMLAIYKANPKAFARNNINALKAGSVLYIPNLEEVQSIGAVQAVRSTRQQNLQWEGIADRSKSKARAKTASNNIAKLRRQLKVAQAELRAERRKVKSLQRQLAAARNQPKEILVHSIPDNELAMKVKDLEMIIQEKDVHIEQLQTMVETARETIKRQALENETMFNKLKAIAPDEVLNTNADASQYKLTLEGTEQGGAVLDQANTSTPATPPTSQNVAATTVVNQKDKINADRFAMILAIISLVLLLVFLWRVYRQMEDKKHQMSAQRLQEHEAVKSDDVEEVDRREPSLNV